MFFELLPFWGGWLILVNQGQQENDQSCNHFSLFHMFDHVQWSDSSLYGCERLLCKEEIYITSVIHTLGWWSFIAPPFNEIHQHVKIDNGFLLYSNFLHKHSISHKTSLQGVCLDQVFARPLREGSSLKLEILSVCFSAAMTQCQLRVVCRRLESVKGSSKHHCPIILNINWGCRPLHPYLGHFRQFPRNWGLALWLTAPLYLSACLLYLNIWVLLLLWYPSFPFSNGESPCQVLLQILP